MSGRLILAGTHSGVGKTTITVGLLVALRRRGLHVQPFKLGPDYIDPTHHTLAAGRPCRNLDTWMTPPDQVRALFCHGMANADLAIIEGVMGLFDGSGYAEETGSTAEVAKLLPAPVLLVVDASKLARSAAALALGYARFDPSLPLAGFILNRVGSDRHATGIVSAIEAVTELPVLGALPRQESLHIPERPLGLVPAAEPGAWQEFAAAAGDLVMGCLDLDRIVRLAEGATPLTIPCPVPHSADHTAANGRPRIAVARDEAFHFTYEENLELLQAAGATLSFFSPLRQDCLPAGTDGIVLSGGFPELHAEQLAANAGMRQALRQAHACGVPIYAECGGLMYLTEAIVDLNRREHPMVGLLPGKSIMAGRLTLGYRLARAASSSWLLSPGELLRGHEFHYSVWEGRPDNLPPAYQLLPASGSGDAWQEGACVGNLWASYVHVHFWGRPELAERFVAACRQRGSHAPSDDPATGQAPDEFVALRLADTPFSLTTATIEDSRRPLTPKNQVFPERPLSACRGSGTHLGQDPGDGTRGLLGVLDYTLGFVTALQFLTLVPPLMRRPCTDAELGRSVGFFPLVGVMLGATLAGLDHLLGLCWPSVVSTGIVLTGWAILTGGLHLDGFLDSCDGLLGGRTPEDRLRIMKDHRVGAFAVLGGVFLLLVKYSALLTLQGRFVALLLAPTLGRWSLSLAVTAFPYGRQQGLGRTMKDQAGWWDLLLATSLTAVAAGWIAGWAGLLALAAAGALTWCVARFALARLPGLTGDIYGAICELVELGILLGILAAERGGVA
jgi:cobyrinic acid a,c-diamide synthase